VTPDIHDTCEVRAWESTGSGHAVRSLGEWVLQKKATISDAEKLNDF